MNTSPRRPPVTVLVTAWQRGREAPIFGREVASRAEAVAVANALMANERTSVIELMPSSERWTAWFSRVPSSCLAYLRSVGAIEESEWHYSTTRSQPLLDLYWCDGAADWSAHGWVVARPGESCPWCTALELKRERAARRRARREDR